MTNTIQRFLSAVVLVSLVALAVILGQGVSLATVSFLGVFVIDEILVSFFLLNRLDWRYVSAQIIYLVGYYYFNFFNVDVGVFYFFANAGVFLSFLLTVYLFSKVPLRDELRSFKPYFVIIALYALVPLLSFSYIIHLDQWVQALFGLILINSITDIAAWFWGKNFGRRRLWPEVSPQKTVEGLFGGMLSATFITATFWHFLVKELDFLTIIVLFCLSGCAQIGDLVQSKLKRECGIKDSSNLIPGHGGVFDRIDSYLFVTPLYVFALMNITELNG